MKESDPHPTDLAAEDGEHHRHGERFYAVTDAISDSIKQRPERVVGPAASFAIHIAFLLLAAFLVIRPASRGDGDPGPEIEFAAMSDDEAVDMAQSTLDLAAPIVEVPVQDAVQPTDVSFDATTDLGSFESTEPGAIDTLGGAGQGVGAGDLLGGGGGTSFFGIESRGRRFMYVVDVSGSMATQNRLGILKRELIQSVDALGAHASYYIIAYSDRSYPMSEKFSWVKASDENRKLSVFTWIRRLDSSGGTEPVKGFEIAFGKFKPRPDVIYFMTDAQDVSGLATVVASLNNRGRKTKVHCIAFGDSGAADVMREIARDSGGQYKFVPSEITP